MYVSCSNLCCVQARFPEIEDALAKVGELGFGAFDLDVFENWQHINPSGLADDPETWATRLGEAVTAAGLKASSFNCGLSRRLADPEPAAWKQYQREFRALLLLADAVECPNITLQPGPVLDGIDREEQAASMRDHLAEALRDAAHRWQGGWLARLGPGLWEGRLTASREPAPAPAGDAPLDLALAGGLDLPAGCNPAADIAEDGGLIVVSVMPFLSIQERGKTISTYVATVARRWTGNSHGLATVATVEPPKLFFPRSLAFTPLLHRVQQSLGGHSERASVAHGAVQQRHNACEDGQNECPDNPGLDVAPSGRLTCGRGHPGRRGCHRAGCGAGFQKITS